jgi:hypothetical protein
MLAGRNTERVLPFCAFSLAPAFTPVEQETIVDILFSVKPPSAAIFWGLLI